ncbi:MAG: serine/threonine-protein kinase [Alphaproteobacteria bacterium]|jgi:serine/threonine-protein kinase
MSIKVNKARWQQIQAILDGVLKQPENQRMRYIKHVCAKDQQLQRDIEDLLTAEDDAPSFLEEPAAALAKTLFGRLEPDANNEQPDMEGKKIGAYLLSELLGKGGMGVVYRGERFQGEFEQEVAIKLLSVSGKDQLSNSDKLERFQHEQQTLASLNHPNIAQLFDGGLTDDMQPYIVMEYVKGLDISRFCKDKNLNLKSRLKLIVQVAEVLAFAHSNLIVHRDIKPSNILINAAGQVKLLDFGIAKLLSDDMPSDLTKTGQSILTPGFAAPEQIKGLNITVATDIYQLGLVMYELITAHKAFSDKADSLYELARVMCEKSPTLPSVIAKEATHSNQVSQVTWSHKLNGDIDAICMKALRLEPEKRYSSMAEFAGDIKAHLAGLVVGARQKNMQYLFGSYCKRNWKPLLAGGSFLVILIAYTITVTVQSRQIKRALEKSLTETEKAQQVSDFMTGIFKSSDPNLVGLEEINAKQLLEKGQADIQQKLQDAPEIRAHMLGVLGDIYYSQGEYEQSSKLLEQALLQQKNSPNQDKYRLANMSTKLAISIGTMDHYEQSEQLLKESLAVYRPVFERSESLESISSSLVIDYAEALNAYALLLRTKGEYGLAEETFNRALGILASLPEMHNEMAVTHDGLAGVYKIQGHYGLAIENMRQSLDILEKVHGEQHSNFTGSLNNMVVILTDLERFDEAESLSKHSYAIQSSMLGPDHPNIAMTLRSLGILSHRKGNFVEAKRYLEQALDNKRQNLTEDNIIVAFILLFLGAVEQDMGHFDSAQKYYQTMLKVFRKYQVADRLLGRGLCQPASLAFARGNWHEAEELYSEALRLIPAGGARAARAQLGMARALLQTESDFPKAELLARGALQIRRDKYPPEHSLIGEAEAVLGQILLRTEKKQEALPLLISAEHILKARALYVQKVSAANLLQGVQQDLAKIKSKHL